MSVLMVAAVTPSNGSKPYVIMGSDTKKIALDLHKDETVETNDFDGKVREVNGKLIGVVGRIPNEFLNEYLQIMSNDDKNLESLTRDIFELAKEVISNSDYEEAKLGIFLAAIENGYPSVGIINVEKDKLDDAYFRTGIAKEGQVIFNKGKKPEKLIKRCIELTSSHVQDIVMDSFLGSGTTAAVAHKMGRRYIGIEMGEHAKTHVIPRLEKVIDGEQGGISKTVNWQGGGGFSFYTLGSSVFDDNGFLNADVKFKDLASYIWWLETKSALNQTENFDNPFLGIHEGTAYYLLYNGILGDRRPNGGNVLTSSVLNHLNECHAHDGKRIVIGEASRLSPARLESLNIEFKQIPYSLYGNKAK